MMAFSGMMVLVTFAIGAVGASGLEVQTVPSVSLVSGKEATLTCGYNRTVFAVYWRYKRASFEMDLLVVLDKHYEAGKKSGPGYEDGRFNVTDDYSLIIRNVQAHDEGTYICEVSDFITGRAVRNNTEVSVIVLAEHPFVRIDQCKRDPSYNQTTEPCIIHTYKDQNIIELTCSVARVKPTVELSWRSLEQLGEAMNEASMKTIDRGDGVFDQTLTIRIDTSKFRTDIHDFICTAEGLAVSGKANQTLTIYDTKNKGLGAAEIVLIVLGVIFPVAAAVIVCKLLYPKKKLKDQRTFINNYPGSDKDNQSNLTLGVFGSAKSGKSTFINYITFSLNEQEDDRATTTNVTEGSDIQKISLTNSIDIWNYKGTFKETADEFFRQFEGKSEGSGRTHIDCPIFVCSYSMYMTNGNQDKKPLPTELGSYFDKVPMVVITNKGTELGQCSQMKEELINTTGIPRDHIFIFENFKLESHTVRSSKLLAFILRCLKEGEKNKQCGPDQPPSEDSPFV